MTGLEKITEQIREEARIASEQELKKTREEVEQINEEGLQNREALKASFVSQTNSQVELLLGRGEALAALQKRKILLKAKQETIEDVIKNAKEMILNLPDNEYFDLLLKMLNRYAKAEAGSILFSPRDKQRVTESFLKELEQRSITLAGESEKIDGGFILVYGDIEENCSFEALLAASKEELQDRISTLIFTNSDSEMER